jgi:hypothetical protein
MRARVLGSVALLATLVLIANTLAPARAEAAGATWQFAPALAPPPAPGVSVAPYPAVPLGPVGDIEFWAPNRGVLITAGDPSGTPVPMGVYAYNGVDWHQLSNECGGTDGRIAWAGPEEFWTISNQRAGQVLANGSSGDLDDVSLCHFQNGQIVGSYAMPLGEPDSYMAMDAAACLSEKDCWFGGRLGEYPNNGSFHLHWNGESVEAVYDSDPHDDHAITSMATYENTLYEGVQLTATDEYGGERAAQTPVLHTIEASVNSIFSDVSLKSAPTCGGGICPSLPEYGVDNPEALSGFLLSSDGGLSGDPPAQTQMWAAAWPLEGFSDSESAEPIIMRCGSDSTYGESEDTHDCDSNVWAQAPSNLLSPGQQLVDIAAEPGTDSAWVTLQSQDGRAHLARIAASEEAGKQTMRIGEQDVLGVGDELGQVGNRGNATAISCPTTNDCWVATDQGWLYHLTEDSENPDLTVGYPEDTDTNFQGVITYRPPDDGDPQLIGDNALSEGSQTNQQPPPPPTPTVQTPITRAHKPLVTDLSSHVVHRYTLVLSFKLTVKARVQLLASRKRRRVAQTSLKTLKAGKHTLMLKLNPHSWPNKLNLKAKPLEALPFVETGGGSGGNTVAAPVKEDAVST